LTDSGRFTHKVATRPAISLAQDRESSPARTGGLTTMLRHQLVKWLPDTSATRHFDTSAVIEEKPGHFDPYNSDETQLHR